MKPSKSLSGTVESDLLRYAENKNTQANQDLCTDTLHTGLEIISRFDIAEAVRLFVEHFYQAVSTQKISKSKVARNESIRQRHEAGETLAELAAVYGISEQRIHQIVHHRRK